MTWREKTDNMGFLIMKGFNVSNLKNIVQLNSLKVWDKFVLLYPKLEHKKMPIVTLSNRMTKTAGCCFVETAEIRLATKFFVNNSNEMLTQTLPHEFAHQIDFWLNGEPSRWHGENWKRVMRAYGAYPETYHKMVI